MTNVYIVTYEDAGQYKTKQFSVVDLTSESLSVEKQRPKLRLNDQSTRNLINHRPSKALWQDYMVTEKCHSPGGKTSQ